MSAVTLPAPGAIVQINGGDTGVTYRELLEFPGYVVGDDGSLWTCRIRNSRTRFGSTWRRLNGTRQHAGHKTNWLCRADGTLVRKFHHELVLTAFKCARPEGLFARHLDGDPANNRPDNLAWGTQKENMEDAVRHETTCRGERNGRHTLSRNDVRLIRELSNQGMPNYLIGQRLGIEQRTVGTIVRGEAWRWFY